MGADFGVRPGCVGLAQELGGIVQPPLAEGHPAQAVGDEGVGGLELRGFFDQGAGFVQLHLAIGQAVAQRVVGVGVVRGEFDHAAQQALHVLEALELLGQHGLVVLQLVVVGEAGAGLFQHLVGLGQLAQVAQQLHLGLGLGDGVAGFGLGQAAQQGAGVGHLALLGQQAGALALHGHFFVTRVGEFQPLEGIGPFAAQVVELGQQQVGLLAVLVQGDVARSRFCRCRVAGAAGGRRLLGRGCGGFCAGQHLLQRGLGGVGLAQFEAHRGQQDPVPSLFWLHLDQLVELGGRVFVTLGGRQTACVSQSQQRRRVSAAHAFLDPGFCIGLLPDHVGRQQVGGQQVGLQGQGLAGGGHGLGELLGHEPGFAGCGPGFGHFQRWLAPGLGGFVDDLGGHLPVAQAGQAAWEVGQHLGLLGRGRQLDEGAQRRGQLTGTAQHDEDLRGEFGRIARLRQGLAPGLGRRQGLLAGTCAQGDLDGALVELAALVAPGGVEVELVGRACIAAVGLDLRDQQLVEQLPVQAGLLGHTGRFRGFCTGRGSSCSGDGRLGHRGCPCCVAHDHGRERGGRQGGAGRVQGGKARHGNSKC